MNAPNKLALGALAVFFLLSTFVHSQAVSLMPIPEQQFFTATGAVCSGCFVYTYQSGTYTPQASYTDYSGLYANTNPIVLNSGGFPATAAGAQVAIWLTPSVLYRIVVQNAAHVQLYQIDGIGGTAQTFNGPVSILSTSNQLIMGATGFTTTLNFPAPASSITLNFPVTADTLVGRATTDTLTNKTLTSPVINTPTVNSVQLAELAWDLCHRNERHHHGHNPFHAHHPAERAFAGRDCGDDDDHWRDRHLRFGLRYHRKRHDSAERIRDLCL